MNDVYQQIDEYRDNNKPSVVSAPKCKASGKMCAKIFDSLDFGGVAKELFETDYSSLLGTDFDDTTTSVKINPGCRLIGFDDNEMNIQIFDYTTDNRLIDQENNIYVNDKLTSYSCQCLGKYNFSMLTQKNLKYFMAYVNRKMWP